MKFRNQGCQSGYAEVELGVHEKEGFIEAEQCYWASCACSTVRREDEEENKGRDMDNKIKLAGDKEHSYCNLEGWAVLTVPLHSNLSVFWLFLFLAFCHHKGDLTHHSMAWGTKRNPSVQEWWHANVYIKKNINTRGCQGIEQAFILQNIVILNMLLFCLFFCYY